MEGVKFSYNLFLQSNSFLSFHNVSSFQQLHSFETIKWLSVDPSLHVTIIQRVKLPPHWEWLARQAVGCSRDTSWRVLFASDDLETTWTFMTFLQRWDSLMTDSLVHLVFTPLAHSLPATEHYYLFHTWSASARSSSRGIFERLQSATEALYFDLFLVC